MNTRLVGFAVSLILLCSVSVAWGQKNADRLFRNGLQLQKSGKLDEAMESFEKCLKSNPAHYGALLAAGKISFSRGDYAAAEQRFADLIDSYPGDDRARLRLAHTKMKTGRADEARAEFSRILEQRPKSVAAMIGLGRAERLLGNGFTANYYFKKALRLRPGAKSVRELVARQEEANLKDLAAHPVSEPEPSAKPAKKTAGQEISGQTRPAGSLPAVNTNSRDSARKRIVEYELSRPDPEPLDDTKDDLPSHPGK